jgi:hypothetical protein
MKTAELYRVLNCGRLEYNNRFCKGKSYMDVFVILR